jgi:hypothetical protein
MTASIPDETAELVWQAAESLYILASCLREGEDSFGPMAEAVRALHVVVVVRPRPQARSRNYQSSAAHRKY